MDEEVQVRHRPPAPVDCGGACNCEIVFGLHYPRAQWDEFVRKERAGTKVPGAGVFKFCIVLVLCPSSLFREMSGMSGDHSREKRLDN